MQPYIREYSTWVTLEIFQRALPYTTRVLYRITIHVFHFFMYNLWIIYVRREGQRNLVVWAAEVLWVAEDRFVYRRHP